MLGLSTAVLNPSCSGVLKGSTTKHKICTALLGQSTLILVHEARAGHSSSTGVLEEQVVYFGLCSSSTGVLLIKHDRASRTSSVPENDFELKRSQFLSKSRANTYIMILRLWGTKPLNQFHQKHSQITDSQF